MSEFNPDMLLILRDVFGMNQESLAKACDLSQTYISFLENGQRRPSEEDLTKIADALGVTPRFLCRDNVRRNFNPVFYRKRLGLAAAEEKRILGLYNWMKSDLALLAQRLEFETNFTVPKIEPHEVDGHIEAIARQVRLRWMVPDGPIRNMTQLMEDAGIIIYPLKADKRFDAMIMRSLDGAPPIVFINKDTPPDRYRFTLAHELGHLVMHETPIGDVDSEADRFASQFLMPGEQIKPKLEHLTMESLQRLKMEWKVSMAALLRRARDLGCLTQGQYEYRIRKMSARGWKTKEPVDLPRETPTLLNEIVDVFVGQQGSSIDSFAQELGVKPWRLGEIYTSCRKDPKERLHLVS